MALTQYFTGKPLVKTVHQKVQPLMGLYTEPGKKTQQAIPGAQLAEPEGVGHLPHVEVFDRVIKPLIEFWANNK